MIDPISAALTVSQLAPLVAQWLEHRSQRAERDDADAFRQWLQNEAFPRLLEQSEQALQSIAGLKAAEKERFDTILEHLVAILAAVAEPTVADYWRKLRPVDQVVLKALFAMLQEDADRCVDGAELAAAAGHAEREVHDTVRYLEEQGWAHCHEFSGKWAADLRSAGIRFVWEASDASGFEAARERLAQLLVADEAARIGVLAEDADVPYPLAHALVQDWADQGLLQFEDDYSPPEAGLVHSVSATLRRAMGRA